VAAAVFWPEAGRWRPGAPWSLDDWVARWGAVAVAAAGDFMRGMGRHDPATMVARYPRLLDRAASRLRARAEAHPATLRRAAAPGDVALEAWREPYAAYFAVEEADLRFRRFDGGMGGPVTRAAFVSGDAVTLLPWDPQRDRVLVVEQFRMGAHSRGDPEPWLIEAVAGRIDAGETPEAAARREAAEEAGLLLGRLFFVARYYPSPGAKTEYLYSYVGIADLPDTAARLGGAACEGEDIRGHVIGFDRLMDLIETGEVDTAPLILTAWWLARHRARLGVMLSGRGSPFGPPPVAPPGA
jgi:nudix-type nucleoside diphosphatase (YffH/AdpP family)